jgi:cytochrome c oxidase subunit IV
MLVITGEANMTLNKRYNRSLVFGLEMMAVLSLVSYFTGPVGWQGFAMFALINVVLLAVIGLVNNWTAIKALPSRLARHAPVAEHKPCQ